MREHCLTILYLVSICDQALGTIDYSNAMFSTHKNILLHTPGARNTMQNYK